MEPGAIQSAIGATGSNGPGARTPAVCGWAGARRGIPSSETVRVHLVNHQLELATVRHYLYHCGQLASRRGRQSHYDTHSHEQPTCVT